MPWKEALWKATGTNLPYEFNVVCASELMPLHCVGKDKHNKGLLYFSLITSQAYGCFEIACAGKDIQQSRGRTADSAVRQLEAVLAAKDIRNPAVFLFLYPMLMKQ